MAQGLPHLPQPPVGLAGKPNADIVEREKTGDAGGPADSANNISGNAQPADGQDALRETEALTERLRELKTTLGDESDRKPKAENGLVHKSTEASGNPNQTAQEPDGAGPQSQPGYIVTDEYLKDLAICLRHSIRNFAKQYFEGKSVEKSGQEKSGVWKDYMVPIKNCEMYLASPERSASIIQSFLWRVIRGQVFDAFRWAGDYQASDHASRLCSVLRPRWQRDRFPGEARDPDKERKFQMWRAMTTALLLDSIDTSEGSTGYEVVQDTIDALVGVVDEAIGPLLGSGDKSYKGELRRILAEAITLDREISRQVARVEWPFPANEAKLVFDPEKMELEPEQGPDTPAAGQEVHLVTAPAMVKRGTPTGADFKTESLLLPFEVSCEPATSSSK